MGLWSKTIDRARTGENRLEDINYSDLVVEAWGTKYININLLLEPYKKTYSKIDLTKSQIIRWSIYKWDRLSLHQEKRGSAFIITDSENKSYMYYNNYKDILTASDYSKNLLSNKQGIKSTFEQTLKRMKKHTTPTVYDLTRDELKLLKKTMKYVNKQINEYKESDMEKVNDWLTK